MTDNNSYGLLLVMSYGGLSLLCPNIYFLTVLIQTSHNSLLTDLTCLVEVVVVMR